MISNLIKKMHRPAGTQGFTLIETLLAILVLTVSIAGPLTIASRGLNAALIAKNKTVAFYLAQDAIEFVRYQRDTNRLNNQPWLTGLDSCVSATGATACTILSISDTIASCSGTCPALTFDSSTNVFSYAATGGTVTPTIFTRSVYIKTPVCNGLGANCNPADLEAQVISVITWTDVGKLSHTIKVQENLLNWQ